MCSGRVEIIPNVWRGAKFAEDTNMIEQVMSSLFLAKYFVRVRGAGVEVKFSWQAQGIVRLRWLVESKFAVTLGFACQRLWS